MKQHLLILLITSQVLHANDHDDEMWHQPYWYETRPAGTPGWKTGDLDDSLKKLSEALNGEYKKSKYLKTTESILSDRWPSVGYSQHTEHQTYINRTNLEGYIHYFDVALIDRNKEKKDNSSMESIYHHLRTSEVINT